jgi:hypothetical protein
MSGFKVRGVRGARRGFTVVDLAVGLAVLSVVGCLLATGMAGARGAARSQACAARLGVMGEGSARFAMGHEGRFAGFTWNPGAAQSQWADLQEQQFNGTGGEAHAAQAVDFLRRRLGPGFPRIQSWIPDVFYWSLPLVEFEGRELSDAFNICPSDDLQNKWRRWPQAFMAGALLPQQPAPVVNNQRWCYASSYNMTVAGFDLNQTSTAPGAPAARVTHSSSGSWTLPAGTTLGPSTMASVAFPSHKAHAFDHADRHFAGRPVFFSTPEARGPVLFFDGSVSVRRSGDARTPWRPHDPEDPRPLVFQYTPAPWQPQTPSGAPTEEVRDQYRFTRDGLLGWDFAR